MYAVQCSNYKTKYCKCKCGNCGTKLLHNANECHGCTEIEECVETLKSDIVMNNPASWLPLPLPRFSVPGPSV